MVPSCTFTILLLNFLHALFSSWQAARTLTAETCWLLQRRGDFVECTEPESSGRVVNPCGKTHVMLCVDDESQPPVRWG